MDTNQTITKRELAIIRTLKDFDLIMLISEIHDHGWRSGKELIPLMVSAAQKEMKAEAQNLEQN